MIVTAMPPADRPRETNGRYAEMPHTDPGQLPLVIDAWVLDGTFEFPARPSTAEECVQFWGAVEIPDAVLEATRLAYNQRQVNDADRWTAGWKRRNPEPERAQDKEKHRARYDADFSVEFADDGPHGPKMIPRSWMRGVARSAKIDQSAMELPAAEASKARATRIRMPGGNWYTVEQICSIFRTRELLPHMVDKARQDALAISVEHDLPLRPRDR